MILRKIQKLTKTRKETNDLLILAVQKITLTTEQALQKARQYCAYSERCHQDVKEKLYSLNLYSKQVNEIMASLIEDNFLNEERYAKSFAGGHFRQKKWGRQKIKYGLKQKNISTYCIKIALMEIDEDDYKKTMQKLFDEKLKLLKTEKNMFAKKAKLQSYLLQKGFESNLIYELLKDL